MTARRKQPRSSLRQTRHGRGRAAEHARHSEDSGIRFFRKSTEDERSFLRMRAMVVLLLATLTTLLEVHLEKQKGMP